MSGAGAEGRAFRLATRPDRAVLAPMLARAFAEDPAMRWLFPHPARRAQRLPRLFRLLFDSDADHGVRLMSPGGEAATFWRAPGHAETPLRAMLRLAPAMLATFGLGLPRALALGEAIDANLPREPFWYLHIAGCDPAHQGKGLGRAAVQAGLDRFAGSGLPAYLETAREANLGFYQGLGFSIVSRWQVPRGGPIFWSMLRR